ncbi:uncharacterized protein FIBRA_04116 [Fibroporia radiculosa]|uniref:F-box domain-containing protein n=1 Tax=Fibroporia radiculosa TaxID=599839 RepID=J4GNX6_9APHY|nr:uncharacterized protein FIBRA_04116 [Fibroporia radiculosa]CCM02040.1 predicted protein [Fibroporia radiculosa]
MDQPNILEPLQASFQDASAPQKPHQVSSSKSLFALESNEMTTYRTTMQVPQVEEAKLEVDALSVGFRCLLIDEIYEIVVRLLYGDGCGKGSVAALAITCRSFQPTAIKVLWGTLNSFAPLVKLLPRHEWYEVQRCDGSRALDIRWGVKAAKLDLTRLQYYVGFIKRFSWRGNLDVRSGAVEYFLQRIPHSVRLFPRVSSFTFTDGLPEVSRLLLHRKAFVNPALLELHYEALPSEARLLAEALDKVRKWCPKLCILRVPSYDDYIHVPTVIPKLSAIICVANLRMFDSMVSITSEALLALARMPRLEIANIRLGPDALNLWTVTCLPRRSFPALKSIALHMFDLDQASLLFLQRMGSERLMFFRVSSEIHPHNPQPLIAYFEALAAAPFAPIMQDLQLQFGHPEYVHAPLCSISLDVLQPLLSIKSLTTFVIRSRNYDLDDAGYRAIALAFPRIHTLLLHPRAAMDTDYPPAHMRSLRHFAEHCSNLAVLGLFIDVTDVPELPEDFESQSLVSVYHFICHGPESYVGRASAYLDAIFPRNALRLEEARAHPEPGDYFVPPRAHSPRMPWTPAGVMDTVRGLYHRRRRS